MSVMAIYLVAVVPSNDVALRVDVYRKKYAQYTRYKIVPHITVIPPFTLRGIAEQDFLKRLRMGMAGKRTFTARFDSVAFFEHSRKTVAYFQPDGMSATRINEMIATAYGSVQEVIRGAFHDYDLTPGSCKPHLTIAEGIPNSTIRQVKKELSAVQEVLTFDVRAIFLYAILDQAKGWEERAEIPFA